MTPRDDSDSVRAMTPTSTPFVRWFSRFLSEKDLPYAVWTLTSSAGVEHVLDTDVVVEAIRGAGPGEQAKIKATIVRIDFANGQVNDYFRHLAMGLIETYDAQGVE